jgi:hypothetical protein
MMKFNENKINHYKIGLRSLTVMCDGNFKDFTKNIKSDFRTRNFLQFSPTIFHTKTTQIR